jgi:hypothetical protein
MSASRGRARTGEIKRTAGGWAIRYRDARGVRRQRGGFRTKGGTHRALRQVLAAAVKWQWIDRNVATDISNPLHERAEFQPF